MVRELCDRRVVIRADHHGIDKSRQDAGGVGDAFAAAQLHIIGAGDDGRAAQLAHALLKRKARTGRGFLKNHRERVAVKRRSRIGRAFGQPFASSLHRMGIIQDGPKLGSGKIGEGEKVTHSCR